MGILLGKGFSAIPLSLKEVFFFKKNNTTPRNLILTIVFQ